MCKGDIQKKSLKKGRVIHKEMVFPVAVEVTVGKNNDQSNK